MKELSIEEKAKAYDEAIEKAKAWCDCDHATTDDKILLKRIFPELKENKDERIRKWLIELVEEVRKTNPTSVEHNGMCSEALAWIEKQAEHANFRNKIQIGDKVTRNKDGVLVNLSQLNRVAKKDKRQGEQKPAWSEEDESLRRRCIGAIDMANLSDYTKDNLLNWLKYLKDRVQPKQEWSEEDATHYNRILKELNLQKEMPINASVIEEVKSDIIWLKSLRPQNRWKPSGEQLHYLSWIANIKLGDGVVEQEVSKHLNELLEDLKKLKE